jgi:LmbE family N-acetylglucosaminyl deacetylase
MHPDTAGPLREAEERAGAAEAGVTVVEFLDHRDGVVEAGPRRRRGGRASTASWRPGLDGVVKAGPALRRDIVRSIRRHQPEIIVSGASACA